MSSLSAVNEVFVPLYDYQCRSCNEVTEVRHGFKESFEGVCPACGSGDMARVFNPAGIVFKGSGFYITDSRKGSAGEGGAPAKSEPAKSEPAKSEPAKSDAPAAAAPPKSETAA